MEGLALLVFTFSLTGAGMKEKQMKSEGLLEKPVMKQKK